MSPAMTSTIAPTRIQLRCAQKEEVPVPKKRRVLPEQEGKYKITMPTGSTARSRKILEKKGKKRSTPNTMSRNETIQRKE